MEQKREKKFWNKVKTVTVNGMTWNAQKWTKPHPTDLHWNHKISIWNQRINWNKHSGKDIRQNHMQLKEKKKILNGGTTPKCTERKWGAVKRGQLGMKAASQESKHQQSWGSGNITQETQRKFKSHLMMYCFPYCPQNGALPQAVQWSIDSAASPSTPPAPLCTSNMTLHTKYTFS